MTQQDVIARLIAMKQAGEPVAKIEAETGLKKGAQWYHWTQFKAQGGSATKAVEAVTAPPKSVAPKVRSGFQLSKAKPRNVVQHYAAIDEFGELPTRKREALLSARKFGHELGSWCARSNDPSGRWNAYCDLCNAIAVVCTEEPDDIPSMVYGTAFKTACKDCELEVAS